MSKILTALAGGALVLSMATGAAAQEVPLPLDDPRAVNACATQFADSRPVKFVQVGDQLRVTCQSALGGELAQPGALAAGVLGLVFIAAAGGGDGTTTTTTTTTTN